MLERAERCRREAIDQAVWRGMEARGQGVAAGSGIARYNNRTLCAYAPRSRRLARRRRGAQAQEAAGEEGHRACDRAFHRPRGLGHPAALADLQVGRGRGPLLLLWRQDMHAHDGDWDICKLQRTHHSPFWQLLSRAEGQGSRACPLLLPALRPGCCRPDPKAQGGKKIAAFDLVSRRPGTALATQQPRVAFAAASSSR